MPASVARLAPGIKRHSDDNELGQIMPRFHHVNPGVAIGAVEPERDFLIGVMGYEPLKGPAELRDRGIGVHCFGSGEGPQIHLSEDPGIVRRTWHLFGGSGFGRV